MVLKNQNIKVGDSFSGLGNHSWKAQSLRRSQTHQDCKLITANFDQHQFNGLIDRQNLTKPICILALYKLKTV